jgi:hypothetical protein
VEKQQVYQADCLLVEPLNPISMIGTGMRSKNRLKTDFPRCLSMYFCMQAQPINQENTTNDVSSSTVRMCHNSSDLYFIAYGEEQVACSA